MLSACSHLASKRLVQRGGVVAAAALASAALSGCGAFGIGKEVAAAPDWFKQRTAELDRSRYYPQLESVPQKPQPTLSEAEWAAIARQLESDYITVTTSPRSAPPEGSDAGAQSFDADARTAISAKAKPPPTN